MRFLHALLALRVELACRNSGMDSLSPNLLESATFPASPAAPFFVRRSRSLGLRASFMTQRIVRNLWWMGLALAAFSGCQTYERYRPTFWPFPEHKLTSYHTPSMRVDAVKDYALRSKGVDSPEQRQITDELARQIQVEPDPLVRQAIVQSIGAYRTPLAEQVLEAGLGDENAAVRVSCCKALGKRAEAASVTSLANAVRSDKEVDVRLAATEALGKIKSPEAIKALAPALDDHDPAMQYVAVQSMKQVTGKDYGPDVQAWRQVAAGGTLPPEHVPTVAERVERMSPFK
ncbi:MAG TPA: HEAT repeat domain-containing protein [Lacipirellulaceae bacterium]|nr:HEAT repeat domain-containing protein [Lacipirellulaceae bacterium]